MFISRSLGYSDGLIVHRVDGHWRSSDESELGIAVLHSSVNCGSVGLTADCDADSVIIEDSHCHSIVDSELVNVSTDYRNSDVGSLVVLLLLIVHCLLHELTLNELISHI